MVTISETKKNAIPTDASNWIDVTAPIHDGMVHWPNDIAVQIKQTSSIVRGANANVTALHMSAHTGTHVDAQKHFIKNGNDISALSLHRLIGAVKIFQIHDQQSITLDEIERLAIGKGDRILFKTANSEKDWAFLPFQTGYVYLETSAARYLRDKEILCVGIDYLSIAGKENGAEVHQLLLEKEIAIIEGLYLKDVTSGAYEMICLPLKISNADGAPARVIIRKI